MANSALDARGKSCPLPIVLAAKILRGLGPGQSLVVQADDRAFPDDIRAWCRKTQHQLTSLDTKAGFYEAVILKP